MVFSYSYIIHSMYVCLLQDFLKILNFKGGVGITIKSKETSS